MANIIVAYDSAGAIGRDGDLPWGRRGLPTDMAHFRHLTTGKTVIMGRKTFESIGHLLRDRENIIVSRDPALRIDGATCVTGLSRAIRRAQHEPFIIGGASIYHAAIEEDLVEHVFATEVHETFDEADTFFPHLGESEWQELSRESHTPGADNKDSYPFDFVTYVRRHKNTAHS